MIPPLTLKQLTGFENTHLSFSQLLETNIHTDAKASLEALAQSAQLAGYRLRIISGYRDFEKQISIWNRKYRGELPLYDEHENKLQRSELTDEQAVFAILKWSALPGTSRHHWGTDFDVALAKEGQPSPRLVPTEYSQGGIYYEFYQWLKVTMPHYNFVFPYQSMNSGVGWEPWHISYEPLSKHIIKQLNPDMIVELFGRQPLLGKEIVVKNIHYIFNNYIL